MAAVARAETDDVELHTAGQADDLEQLAHLVLGQQLLRRGRGADIGALQQLEQAAVEQEARLRGATTLGTLLALSWPVGLACCLTWGAVAAATRISSLSALVALALAPIFVVWFGNPHQVYLVGLLALIGWIRHRANITRLLDGVEPKIGKKKTE